MEAENSTRDRWKGEGVDSTDRGKWGEKGIKRQQMHCSIWGGGHTGWEKVKIMGFEGQSKLCLNSLQNLEKLANAIQMQEESVWKWRERSWHQVSGGLHTQGRLLTLTNSHMFRSSTWGSLHEATQIPTWQLKSSTLAAYLQKEKNSSFCFLISTLCQSLLAKEQQKTTTKKQELVGLSLNLLKLQDPINISFEMKIVCSW